MKSLIWQLQTNLLFALINVSRARIRPKGPWQAELGGTPGPRPLTTQPPQSYMQTHHLERTCKCRSTTDFFWFLFTSDISFRWFFLICAFPFLLRAPCQSKCNQSGHKLHLWMLGAPIKKTLWQPQKYIFFSFSSFLCDRNLSFQSVILKEKRGNNLINQYI